MIFDELDAKMRTYEQSLDQVLLPDMYMVAKDVGCMAEASDFPDG